MSWTLVTGAGKGLGTDIALRLAQAGHDLVLHYRNSRQGAEAIAGECRAYGVKAELIEGNFGDRRERMEFIERYLYRFPETKHLICNVGSWSAGPLSETSFDRWYDLFETNLHASFDLCKSLIPSLKKSQGTIITIGVCGLGRSRADIFSAAYNVSKEALWAMTLSFAKELASFGVRANMVSPGMISRGAPPSNDEVRIPMKRAATRKEVAELVALLIDNKSEYITGQNIDVAGGLRL